MVAAPAAVVTGWPSGTAAATGRPSRRSTVSAWASRWIVAGDRYAVRFTADSSR